MVAQGGTIGLFLFLRLGIHFLSLAHGLRCRRLRDDLLDIDMFAPGRDQLLYVSSKIRLFWIVFKSAVGPSSPDYSSAAELVIPAK